MDYYWFYKQELLEKAKDKYHDKRGKEKASKYYEDSKEILKEKARNKYRDLPEEEKELKRQYSRNQCRKLKNNYFNNIKDE